MGNRSLDDFLTTDDETTDDETTDDEAATEGAVDEAVGDETAGGEAGSTDRGDETDASGEEAETATAVVEPAVSTYVGRSGECVACGDTAQRRWHSDNGPVCPDCKEW
jgi:cobalamin biosynthesis protein CobT